MILCSSAAAWFSGEVFVDLVVILLFCSALLCCLLLGWPVLYALLFGLVIFILYARVKGLSFREIFTLCIEGIKTVKNVLIIFVLIGILTALWRSAGTIATLVSYASGLINPSLLLLMTFLLNCLVSLLTGSSFATGATMGVVCGTIAGAMGANIVFVGGAVLSGVYFGDRCSPVSSSAVLVSELTKTSLYDNIKNMLRTALIPFLAACLIYWLLGRFSPSAGSVDLDVRAIFSAEFRIHWIALLPAGLIIILSLLRLGAKRAMLVSILASLPISLFLQQKALGETLLATVTGFHAADATVAAMLDGGGLVSMLRGGAIVMISSSYSRLLQKIGLLDGIRRLIEKFSARTTSYCATMTAALLTAVIACNQSLSIILTRLLCEDLSPGNGPRQALDIEDSAVVIAPLVPWSIAGAIPLASAGAPESSVLFACYLYLIPLWRLLLSFAEKQRSKHAGITP